MKRCPTFLKRCVVVLGLLSTPALAQAPVPVRDGAELLQMLDRLQVVGSVLYVAAHPDDENTAALTYFSKGRKLRTAYLALTRGGGGQDLIGPELDDSLAVIRTQELLAARRVDGAEQFFTRAVDFGFSKTTEESLAIWGREAVLSDVVWVIRSFRPDVIVTRFSPTAGAGHGHHSASVVLALEAFQAAADPVRFPEQLKLVQPWQTKRIFWNSYHFDGSAVAPGNGLPLDIGQFDPLIGKSYAELAAESRSMHRSQGFGAVATRGSFVERFELLAPAPGGKGPAQKDPFEGIDQTWHRVQGSEALRQLLSKARASYQIERPSAMLPLLLQARVAMDKLPADPWVDVKRRELEEVIRCAAGIWVEAISDRQGAAPGTAVTIAATVLARGGHPVWLESVALTPFSESHRRGIALTENKSLTESFTINLPATAPCSQPLWLQEPRVGGLHGKVPMAFTGLPEGPPAMTASFQLLIDGVALELQVPVQYRFRDPVLGETYQPFVVTPRVMVNLVEPVLLFRNAAPQEVRLQVVAGANDVSGKVRIQVPKGWLAEPAELPYSLSRASDEVKLSARLTPPPSPQSAELKVLVDGVPAHGLVRIAYPHIPLQTLFPPATCKLVRMDLRSNGETGVHRIGYVMGAGDEIPRCLRLLGYDVDLLTDEALESRDLSGYEAIVVGIRAFNTRQRLAQLKDRLLDYVSKGGTEVVLYNVAGGGFLASGPVTESMGPYPFHISRDRVTDETAPMRFLAPEHPILKGPNPITAADFEGWVQERGLYFADTWDPRYTPLFSTQDPGEKAQEGSLLVASYGKGHFVYTGLAFFRQLPDGVPGAYRLFANLLAVGKAHE